ncbi:hypothetical protein ACROYT_G039929 [Oculina patagonica]
MEELKTLGGQHGTSDAFHTLIKENGKVRGLGKLPKSTKHDSFLFVYIAARKLVYRKDACGNATWNGTKGRETAPKRGNNKSDNHWSDGLNLHITSRDTANVATASDPRTPATTRSAAKAGVTALTGQSANMFVISTAEIQGFQQQHVLWPQRQAAGPHHLAVDAHQHARSPQQIAARPQQQISGPQQQIAGAQQLSVGPHLQAAGLHQQATRL